MSNRQPDRARDQTQFKPARSIVRRDGRDRRSSSIGGRRLNDVETLFQAAGAARAGCDDKLAGLDNEPEILVIEAELLRAELETGCPLLARLEREALKAGQLLHGAGDARHQVADVELDDLVARAVADVLEI